MDIYSKTQLAKFPLNPTVTSTRIGLLSPLALAVMVSCLGNSFSAQASCIETSPPSTPGPCEGTYGGDMILVTGGSGGHGKIDLTDPTIIGNITGGNGGNSRSGGNGGIGGDGMHAAGTITINNGIRITGGNGGNSDNGRGGNGGNGIYVTGLSTINNNGQISGGNGGNSLNGGGGSYGIIAMSSSTINNNGQINGGNGGNGGNNGLRGNGGGGIYVTDGSTIVNRGSIQGGNGGGNGSSQNTSGAGGSGINTWGNSVIHNYGSITGGTQGSRDGSSTNKANAITFNAANNELWLYHGSVITGNVVAQSGGVDKLILAGTTDSSFDLSSIGSSAQYRNFDVYQKQGSSVWTLNGTSAASQLWDVQAGTLRITSHANPTAISTAVGSGATLQLASGARHAGSSRLLSGATLSLAPGAIGTANFGADLTLDAGSILRITASGSSAGHYDQFVVAGTANVAGKASVDVTSVNTLAVGQTLAGVLSAGTLVGDFSAVDDNSALFDFQSVVNGNSIDLTTIFTGTTPTPNPTPTQPSIASSAQAVGAASLFTQLITQGGASPAMQQVITELGQIPTTQGVSDALDQTLPLFNGSNRLALNSALIGISSIIQQRSGQASGDTPSLEGEVWLKPFASRASQHKRDGDAGFTADSYGLMLGADAQLSDYHRAGLAFAYAQVDVNGRSHIAPNSSNTDLYQLIGYGNYALTDATQLDWQVDYGQARTKGQRQILFMGSTAKSNYDSQIAHAGLGFSHAYALTESTTLTPRISADYTWIEDDSYREKNANALNLQIKRRATESLILGLETTLSHAFTERTQASLTLGMGYDAINERTSTTSAYAGAPGLSFSTPGIKSDPWLGTVGSALSYRVSDSSEISLHYDAELRQSFSNQSAALQARWAF